jgi:hypothetical protein
MFHMELCLNITDNTTGKERMRAKRTDRNQAEIVKALCKIGYSVFITSSLGNGFPDFVLGAHGKNYFFEVKDPLQSKYNRRLTNAENLFHLTWKGQVSVICTCQEAIDIIKADVV